MLKKLAVQLQYSENDFDLAFGTLQKKGLLPDGWSKTDFCDGELIDLNISETMPDESLQMCMGMMLMLIGVKLANSEKV